MRPTCGSPNIDFRIRVRVAADQSQDRGLVIERVKDSRHDRLEFERDNPDLYSQLRDVVLNDSRDLRPLSVARIGENRELHRLTGGVYQSSVASPGKTCRAQQRRGFFQRPWGV